MAVDEMLRQEEAPVPKEAYRFQFTEAELREVQRAQMKPHKKDVIFNLVLYSFMFSVAFHSMWDVILALAIASLINTVISSLTRRRMRRKEWEWTIPRICISTYEYEVFEGYMIVKIYRNGEKIYESKNYFTDLARVDIFGACLSVQFGQTAFLMRKEELREDSVFYRYMADRK